MVCTLRQFWEFFIFGQWEFQDPKMEVLYHIPGHIALDSPLHRPEITHIIIYIYNVYTYIYIYYTYIYIYILWYLKIILGYLNTLGFPTQKDFF